MGAFLDLGEKNAENSAIVRQTKLWKLKNHGWIELNKEDPIIIIFIKSMPKNQRKRANYCDRHDFILKARP